MTLTRRSFLAGLITAPAIVHAANIMKVRPVVDEILSLPGFAQQWADPDAFSIDFIRQITSMMRERNIPSFEHAGEKYLYLTTSHFGMLPIDNRLQVVPILT